MPTGGKRKGAGRKVGSTTKRTREIAELCAASKDLTPLEVMLLAMKNHAEAKQWDDAAKIAEKAAPYMHPRLSAITHNGTMKFDFSRMSDEELDQYIATARVLHGRKSEDT